MRCPDPPLHPDRRAAGPGAGETLCASVPALVVGAHRRAGRMAGRQTERELTIGACWPPVICGVVIPEAESQSDNVGRFGNPSYSIRAARLAEVIMRSSVAIVTVLLLALPLRADKADVIKAVDARAEP